MCGSGPEYTVVGKEILGKSGSLSMCTEWSRINPRRNCITTAQVNITSKRHWHELDIRSDPFILKPCQSSDRGELRKSNLLVNGPSRALQGKGLQWNQNQARKSSPVMPEPGPGPAGDVKDDISSSPGPQGIN